MGRSQVPWGSAASLGAAREAYFLYVERAIEGANEADGPYRRSSSILSDRLLEQ